MSLIGTVSPLLVLLVSAISFLPTLTWFQEVLNCVERYLIFAQLIAIVILSVRIISRQSKFHLLLLAATCFFLFVSLVQIKEFYFYSPRIAEGKEGGDKLSLYYLNLEIGYADHSKVLEQLKQLQPDLIFYAEQPRDWDLTTGFYADYQYRTITEDVDGYDLQVISKYPLELKAKSDDILKPSYLIQNVELNQEKNFELIFWHARQPLFQKSFYVNKALCRRLATRVKHGGGDYLVVGDFNATPFTSCYKWFVGTSGVEHYLWGDGLMRTWDAKHASFRLTIDHIFYTEKFYRNKFQRMEPVGSDHFPLYLELFF